MLWNAAGSNVLWISTIGWFETDSEQFPRLKVHVFRRSMRLARFQHAKQADKHETV